MRIEEQSLNGAVSSKCIRFDQSFNPSIDRACVWSGTQIMPPLSLILVLHRGVPQSSVVGEDVYTFGLGYLWLMSAAILAFFLPKSVLATLED